MSLLSSIASGQSEAPAPSLRDTLYGDCALSLWPASDPGPDAYPWSVFAAARAQMARGDREGAVKNWYAIAYQPGLEPRHYLQAWQFLRQNGQQPPPETARQVLGIVVEVRMPQGLDLLAAYRDYSARYYNFSGRGVVWEHPNDSLNGLIDALLAAAAQVVSKIGPWSQARPLAPPNGQARLSFLTPSGLYFGQGAMDVLYRDSLGGPVLYHAGKLMEAMIDYSHSMVPGGL